MLKQSFLGAVLIIGALAFAACTSADSRPTAAAGARKLDMMNTMCVVMPGEQAGDNTVEYQGKIYHVCCTSCVREFNNDPEKYVRAYEANPAAYDAK